MMEFQELEGERRGSKVLCAVDHHLYRYSRGTKKDTNVHFLACYLDRPTQTMLKTNPNVVPCKGTAFVKENKILIHKAHNHTPDEAIYKRLHARHKVRESVTSSSQPTKQAFDDAMRDEPGGELVAWGAMYRTCLREKRLSYPAPPENCEAADRFMKSDTYKDKEFAQFYQGLVTSEDQSALIFAHPQNLEKLGEETKQINCDGTFR